MRANTTLLLSLTLATGLNVVHAEPVPTFESCPAKVESNRIPALRLKFDDATGRRFSTVIKQASKGPVNFAGHYVLATWGCGGSCVMAAAVDTRSGRVTSLPFTVSDWPMDVTEPIAYKANSCLLIVRGSRNESDEHGTYYYAFDGKTFVLRGAVSDIRR